MNVRNLTRGMYTCHICRAKVLENDWDLHMYKHMSAKYRPGRNPMIIDKPARRVRSSNNPGKMKIGTLVLIAGIGIAAWWYFTKKA